MATEIEVTFAKSQSLPDTVPEGRLQLVDESAGATEVEAYVGTQNGTKKITDKDKASIEALKDGTLVPKFAENLTPYAEDSGTTQTQPFFLEGTATGNGESRVDAKQVPAFAFLQEKRGNMVCVNQLADCQTVTASTERNNISSQLFTYYPGHTYLCCFDYKIEANIGNIRFLYGVWNNSLTEYARMQCPNVTSLSGRLQFIFVNQTGAMSDYSSVKIILQMLGTDISETNKVTTSNVAFIDLTQWFNGNIPAYLLSHPEAFGRYYKGSLAYEPGRLEPATGRYLTSVGRNIWDEVWEVGSINSDTGLNDDSVNTLIRSKNYVDVSSAIEYYALIAGKNARIFFYNEDKNFLSYYDRTRNGTFIIPNNAHFIRFRMNTAYGTTYNHDITISEYYPGESGYDQHYPHEVLATIDTGTESLYSAGSAYDSKVPSGLITRRIGSVDLGTLDWILDGNRFAVIIDSAKKYSTRSPFLCALYSFTGLTGDTDKTGFIGAIGTLYTVYIYDSAYTDAASFKAAMSGVMLYYELATPTTEQGTPFQENVPIDDFGQLSWSDTNVPQGNQIFYPVDYKAYEDTLIKYTDGDATSLVRKTDYASSSEAGVMKVNSTLGIGINASGTIYTNIATRPMIKAGNYQFHSIVPSNQHESVFYGLAKAAGANLASSTEETAPDGTNPGVYPAAAKTAIQNMLGITDLIGDINTVLDSVNGVVI